MLVKFRIEIENETAAVGGGITISFGFSYELEPMEGDEDSLAMDLRNLHRIPFGDQIDMLTNTLIILMDVEEMPILHKYWICDTLTNEINHSLKRGAINSTVTQTYNKRQ